MQDEDRESINTARLEVHKAAEVLKTNSSDVGAAQYNCGEAKPYIALTVNYVTLGKESPVSRIKRAKKLVDEILTEY